VDSSDNLYVVDQERRSIEKFGSNGTFMQRLTLQSANDNDTSKLEDLELDKYDNIYVTDRGDHNIKVFVPVK
jgi:uncharacterized protein YjiK